jgi:hypothetical protein
MKTHKSKYLLLLTLVFLFSCNKGDGPDIYKSKLAASRRVEAKMQLSALYTAVAFLMVDTNQAITDLSLYDLVTPGQAMRYHFGFSKAVPANEIEFKLEGKSVRANPNRNSTQELAGFVADESLKSVNFQELAQKYCPDAYPDEEFFRACAIGNIDDDSEVDVWIFQRRWGASSNPSTDYIHVQDDTKI